MAFFEQVGKLLTDTGQNVAQQTKKFADVTQINIAISEKEKRISQLFLNIGQSYYERHKSDEAAEESERIDEVNTLYAEILQNRERIKQIKGVIKCENCGADVPLSAAFCSACGTTVVRTENITESTGNERLCPVCNAAVDKDNLFCNHCGTKVENDQR